MLSPIMKGFLIGSSLAILAYMFGLIPDVSRGILIGIVSGVLAGFTIQKKLDKKNSKKD